MQRRGIQQLHSCRLMCGGFAHFGLITSLSALRELVFGPRGLWPQKKRPSKAQHADTTEKTPHTVSEIHPWLCGACGDHPWKWPDPCKDNLCKAHQGSFQTSETPHHNTQRVCASTIRSHPSSHYDPVTGTSSGIMLEVHIWSYRTSRSASFVMQRGGEDDIVQTGSYKQCTVLRNKMLMLLLQSY